MRPVPCTATHTRGDRRRSGREGSRRHNAPSPHGPSLGNLSKIAKTRQLHGLIKESARGRHWTIASSNSTQTQVELKLSSTWTQRRDGKAKPAPGQPGAESTGIDGSRQESSCAPSHPVPSPAQATSLMKISTSRGAILHKPDLPGPPTRHASSRRLFRLPTLLFRLPLPTFRLPLPTFRKPGNVSSAAKASRAGEMRRTGKFDSRRFPSTRPLVHAPRRLEEATAAVSSKPPYRATTRRFHRNRPTLRIYPFAVAIG